MVFVRRLGRIWHVVRSFGAYPGETEVHRGKRQIVVGYFFFGGLVRIPFAAGEFGAGTPWAGAVDVGAVLVAVVALGALRIRPDWFTWIVNAGLFFSLAEVLAATIIAGGLIPSSLVIAFGMIAVVGAVIVFDTWAALAWYLAFLLTLALAVVLPGVIPPIHVVETTAANIAFTIFGVTLFVFAAMSYFVRQRDRLQTESDGLLHNILPDEIARRLKASQTMIADDYASASVLFADVVDFTPMSAEMSPPELVGLLNAVFTTFDGFVSELDLEKIKTVGDAYMVAAGVPRERPDHAHAIADLALRIRDCVETTTFAGHRISVRIGINSGPVVAGIVGTHKFAYDLWGDVVNIASRMESEGVPGSIQVSPATYELIRDRYVCEPRGGVRIKGKGDMNTFILASKRGEH
jgi:guanylate cyclase